MSLTLELPTEIESELREAAAREGRDVGLYIIEAATERARLEKARQLEKARREWAAIVAENQKLGLYDE